jgi:hypothetical protein
MPINTRCASQEVSMMNIPALYLCISDLCRRSHEATSLSRENPQISIAIPHAYIKIQLFIEIRHPFEPMDGFDVSEHFRPSWELDLKI